MTNKPCWYTRRDELHSGQIFRLFDGDFVRLDRRVEGDGTKWEVANWYSGSWAYEGSEIEPGDLIGEPIADFQAETAKASLTPPAC